jgi:glycosyltransferase involved in cell wall biosynthesis
LKIGIDARLTYYRDGGISSYTRHLIHALERIDKQNDYTIFQSRKDKKRLSQQFKSAPLWTPAHHRIERLALSIELAGHGLDVFHSPDFIPPYRAAKHHIITVHDLTFLHYPEYLTADSRAYYNAQIEAACSHADHILSVSEATKRDLIEMLHVPESKITVQPHGVDDSFRPSHPDASLNLPKEYFLHVGTIEPRKNIIGLLKAYRILLRDYPDAPPLLLVGRKGWLFEETEREMRGFGDKLIWREDISDAQLPSVYSAAIANITVSHYEGFGMPALEGMACGAVPIVSNRSSLPEVVGELGLLVNPDDSQEIAQTLAKALNDSSWLQGESKKAIERAKLFTWERSAQIALAIYTGTGESPIMKHN